MKSLLFLLIIYAFIPLVFCQDATNTIEGAGAEEYDDDIGPDALNIQSLEQLEKLIEKEGLHVLTNIARGEVELQILQITYLANKAEKEKLEGLTSDEEVDRIYKDVGDLVYGLTESLKFRANTYKFFNSRGMEQLVYSNFLKGPDHLKDKLLQLILVLHEVAPSTLIHILRLSFATDLIEVIQSHYSEPRTKEHAIDILSFWLPKNPEVQATVLESKGLEAFYSSIKDLDQEAVYKLLKLFSVIFKEHLEATSDKGKNENLEKYRQYQKMEFVKLLSTQKMCLGFVDVFQTIFAYQLSENKVLVPVLDIISLLKPYCGEMYKFNTKAVKFLDELRTYVSEPKNGLYFKRMGINMTELKKILKEYTASYIAKKGEF